MRNAFTGLVALLLISLFVGCSNDATSPAPSPGDGTLHGQIGAVDFEFTIGGDEPGDPVRGPFLLRGTNLHYDDEAGALVVDLTVVNAGSFTHHEPVGLTFIQLDPDEVTLLNPDNDIHNDGAAIVFHFANDDGVWTPGESSLPRTTEFGVSKGVAIAFVARLDLGEATDVGTISGLVWNDDNQNGARDDGEPGLPGVGITLYTFAGDNNATLKLRYTVTGRDGHYAFEALRAGGYVVSKAPSTVDFIPTTPTEIHVLLTELDGDVSDYDGANFGCIPRISPPPPGIDNHVRVTGKFHEPETFVSVSFESYMCPDTIPVPVEPRNDPPVGECVGGRVRGTVTDVAPARHAIRVMATWVIADATTFPADIQVGARLDVHAHRLGTATVWVADSIERWDGALDEIQGPVEALEVSPDGHVRLLVMDTWIDAPIATPGG